MCACFNFVILFFLAVWSQTVSSYLFKISMLPVTLLSLLWARLDTRFSSHTTLISTLCMSKRRMQSMERPHDLLILWMSCMKWLEIFTHLLCVASEANTSLSPLSFPLRCRGRVWSTWGTRVLMWLQSSCTLSRMFQSSETIWPPHANTSHSSASSSQSTTHILPSYFYPHKLQSKVHEFICL